MILNPQETFIVARQLNDPADSNTYYVQAVIRNAKTDAIIATLNLDSKGSQRFTREWQVVSDPTGLGLYITVTTTVYTDSGYTTKSTAYAVEQYELLIQDRINPFIRGGGGGADVDYKRIRKIIQEEIGIPPEQKEPDLVPISEGLQAVITEIRSLPRPKDTDLSQILEQLARLEAAVKAIPASRTVDLTPVTDILQERLNPSAVTDLFTPTVDKTNQKFEDTHKRIRDLYLNDIEEIKKQLRSLGEQLDEISYIVPNGQIINRHKNVN